MDHARCSCKGERNPACAFHGDCGTDPRLPYVLTENDRDMLRRMRIAGDRLSDIQQVRQADEDRFRRD